MYYLYDTTPKLNGFNNEFKATPNFYKENH